MNDNLSIGSDQSNGDAIEFADDVANDPFDNTSAGRDSTQVQQSISVGDLQTVIDQLGGQRSLSDVAPNVLSASAATVQAEDTTGDPLEGLREGYEDHVKTMDDIRLESEIRNHEAQLRERQDQKRLAANTIENSDAIATGVNVGVGILGLSSLRAGVLGILGGLGISLRGAEVIESVAGNSAAVAADEITRLDAELQALKNEKARRDKVPPPLPDGPEVTGPLPDRPETTASLPEQIADQREIASTEREKQAQLENIAKTDPQFRDQALAEAEKAAQRAEAAESRADALQAKQDETVNALAAAEEQAAKEAAERAREQQRRERDDRSEPNGGQVDGADRGVGRNDVPDSF